MLPFESGLAILRFIGIEQLAARKTHILEVIGSSPVPDTGFSVQRLTTA